LSTGAGGFPFRIHRHAGRVGQGELVLEEIHLVAGVVVVGARFQRTPVVLPQIAEIDLMAVVERHVHPLVRETLVRDVLVAELELEQMLRVAQREAERLVLGLVL
jgi:hypothetical protein